MSRFEIDSFPPCKQDAKRMAEIFDIFYPEKCLPDDIMEVRRNYCAQFLIVRDNNNDGLIVGFMLIIPITDVYFARYIKGDLFGLGEGSFPKEAFAIGESLTDKFVIDCLMTDVERCKASVWPELMLRAVVDLNDMTDGNAQIVGSADLPSGHYFYNQCLQMKPINKTETHTIYKTTLSELTDVIMKVKMPISI